MDTSSFYEKHNPRIRNNDNQNSSQSLMERLFFIPLPDGNISEDEDDVSEEMDEVTECRVSFFSLVV